MLRYVRENNDFFIYNPINQIVGYILSEDPTYITTYNNARNIISAIDRDDLLEALVKSYLNV